MWGLKDNRSQEEKTYQKVADELARKNVIANSFDGKAAESTKQGFEVLYPLGGYIPKAVTALENVIAKAQ